MHERRALAGAWTRARAKRTSGEEKGRSGEGKFRCSLTPLVHLVERRRHFLAVMLGQIFPQGCPAQLATAQPQLPRERFGLGEGLGVERMDKKCESGSRLEGIIASIFVV